VSIKRQLHADRYFSRFEVAKLNTNYLSGWKKEGQNDFLTLETFGCFVGMRLWFPVHKLQKIDDVGKWQCLYCNLLVE